eukprot:TRINITY_DN76150_c0_g2_i1.p1 TRINITY_DN76150_c0_g2~~TRINITY_DN76150_c0_g2_i1.p1  ORF type:complete len:111 (+),score=15.27 TRINITY_DN76150_c0_g2_i1:81-413(+)
MAARLARVNLTKPAVSLSRLGLAAPAWRPPLDVKHNVYTYQSHAGNVFQLLPGLNKDVLTAYDLVEDEERALIVPMQLTENKPMDSSELSFEGRAVQQECRDRSRMPSSA